jgi:hypothetical protein
MKCVPNVGLSAASFSRNVLVRIIERLNNLS